MTTSELVSELVKRVKALDELKDKTVDDITLQVHWNPNKILVSFLDTKATYTFHVDDI